MTTPMASTLKLKNTNQYIINLLSSLPRTAPVLARNGPLRVQPFNTLLSRNLIVDPSGLRNPSAKPHTPPKVSPTQ